MNARHVALLALLAVAGSGSALCAQPPDAPPPDQNGAPSDQYAPPADQYAPPADQYAPPADQGTMPADDNGSPEQIAQYDQVPPAPDDQYYAPPSYEGQPAPVPANGEVDINFFYSNLAPYGHWINRGSYGWVWLPFGVRAGWRPYTLGHWVMTDYGWTWVSDEPFGWAAYHYGRWRFDDEYGWVWVPGYEWGPAWVAWRNGGGYIGWAPLPPEVRFRAGFGLDFGGVNLDVVLAPTHYCFVEERSFLAPRVAAYVAPPARNVTIINNTTNITNYTVVNNKIVNRGVEAQHIEQVTGRRVQQYQVAAVATGTAHGSQVRGNQLSVFRPALVKRSATPPAPPPSARLSSAPAALAHQHQQEMQDLQKSQAAERSRLQQYHQAERQSYQGATTGSGQPRRQPQPQGGSAAQGESRQPPERRSEAQPGTSQSQPANRRPAGSYQELQQRHQQEEQAQQAQHQREVQQLQARQHAEQSQARPQPPRNDRQGGQRAPKDQKEKHPNGPPPSRR
jgi:hypothetical protein